MEQLYEFFTRKLKSTPTDFLRYKYNQIKWQGRFWGLVGPRGVGKSTMLLQYIKLHLNIKDTLYVSADQLYFSCGGPEANDHFYVFNKTTLQGIHWVHDRKDATALLLAKASDKDFFYYIFNDYNDYIPESLPIEMEPLKRYLIKEKHVNLKGDSMNPLIIKIKFQLP